MSLHRDHLGSIVAISDEAGQIVTWMAFDASGDSRGIRPIYNARGYLETLDGRPYGKTGRETERRQPAQLPITGAGDWKVIL